MAELRKQKVKNAFLFMGVKYVLIELFPYPSRTAASGAALLYTQKPSPFIEQGGLFIIQKLSKA